VKAELTRRARIEAALRRASDLLCLWRLCGNAACRRARCCRGSAGTCARRNYGALPESVRAFHLSHLAARRAGVSFEQFRDDMDGKAETDAFFAWRRAAHAPPRKRGERLRRT
jgi:hypothetical protein